MSDQHAIQSGDFRVLRIAAVAVFACIALEPLAGTEACRPKLAITNARLGEWRLPSMERKWTATVTADAGACTSTAGYFVIGFSRAKEYGPEVDFREQFVWNVPSVLVGVDFWADEAVDAVWIDSIQPCPCAR